MNQVVEVMEVEKFILLNMWALFRSDWNLMKMNSFDDFDASNGFKMSFCVGIQVFMIFRCLYINLEFLEVKK